MTFDTQTSTLLVLPLLASLSLFACEAGSSDEEQAGSETAGESDTGTDTGEQAQAWVLVGNTRGDNVIRIDASSGEIGGELISAGAGGLLHPDTLRLRDGMIYVASGDVPEESAILRFDLDGNFVDEFAGGGGLHRPYGFDFGSDGTLYVASFLTDQLLRYDGQSGAFIDEFAKGDGVDGGLNGPNDVQFGPDGGLYVSTQGSVAVDGAPTYPGLASEVLRFDIGTGASTVFAAQPTPLPDSLGFVSMLGVGWGPDCEGGGDCGFFTTDYAGGLRRYDADGNLSWEVSTTHVAGAASGALAFGANGEVFVPAFVEMTPGVLQRFVAESGAAMPAMGSEGAIFAGPDAALVRPIGVLFLPADS